MWKPGKFTMFHENMVDFSVTNEPVNPAKTSGASEMDLLNCRFLFPSSKVGFGHLATCTTEGPGRPGLDWLVMIDRLLTHTNPWDERYI